MADAPPSATRFAPQSIELEVGVAVVITPSLRGFCRRFPARHSVVIEGRAAWLEAAASAFRLIYQGDGRIKIATESSRKEDC